MYTQSIIDQLLPIILTILIAACVTGVVGIYHWILQRLPTNVQAMVSQVAQQVVAAVEQSHAGSIGQDKKIAAVADVNEILAQSHLPAPVQMIDSAIESAVFSLNQLKPKSGA